MTTVETVPKKLEKAVVELIDRTWIQLEKIFGQEARNPDFLKSYINNPDGTLKTHNELFAQLMELSKTDNTKTAD